MSACDVCEYKNLPIITTSGKNTNSKTPHLATDTTDDVKGKTQSMKGEREECKRGHNPPRLQRVRSQV